MQSSWFSIHIFQNGDPHRLLTEAVAPLVNMLRSADLIERWFFIRYWEQGRHLRLRLLPRGGPPADLGALVVPRIEEHLRVHPSLVRYPAAFMPPEFTSEYRRERGEAALRERYGPEGRIPFAPNNSVVVAAYEPELDRYGGPVGLDIAERHFEASSDLALAHLSSANGGDPQVMLGRAFHMTLHACLVILPGTAERLTFLRDHGRRWAGILPERHTHAFQRKYRAARDRLLPVARGCVEGLQRVESLPRLERPWVHHLRDLDRQLAAAIQAGSLTLPPQVDSAAVRAHLLGCYVHMNNNRLGLSILDETYLAFLLEQVLPELALP